METMELLGMLVFAGIVGFYCYVFANNIQRFFRWLFVREYVMTSDTIIRVVGWWKICAKERHSPQDVVHWSPEEDTQDDGEWWKKG